MNATCGRKCAELLPSCGPVGCLGKMLLASSISVSYTHLDVYKRQVQDSIPFRNMFPDGLCRLEGGAFSKTIAFEDVNYRLASPEDQRDIFEHLCDFYNGYDPTIGVQMSLSSRYVEHGPEEDLFGICLLYTSRCV